MSAVDTISYTETVRCHYAEHLRSGTEQHELVPYMKLLRACESLSYLIVLAFFCAGTNSSSPRHPQDHAAFQLRWC